MIFNDEFDRTLYLILENDNNNRNLICDFIKDIPLELYIKIRSELNKFREYIKQDISVLDVSEDLCLRGSIIYDSVYRYSFLIDMIEDSLIISRDILMDNKFYKDMEIKLNAKNNYNDISKFGFQSVGYFKDFSEYRDVKYDLISTVFGNMMTFTSYGDFKKRKKISRKFEDLDKYDSKYGLSRVRKIN